MTRCANKNDWWLTEAYDCMKSRFDKLRHVPFGFTTITGRKQHLIFMDVQHFQPQDLQVALVNGYVHVRGCHPERKDDDGWVERSFSRKIKVPEEVAPDSLESHISSDGILSIKVENYKSAVQPVKTHVIPVVVESL